MGDSDEEYDRRRSRDKFRRERNDYSDRRDDRRGGRDPWEDRGRDAWSSRSRDNGRREPYRDYDRGRRDRYSPPRHDMSPPQMKRMRRDWEDSGGYHHYDMPYGGGGPMPGPPPHAGWGPGPGDMPNMPPQQQPHYGGPPGQRGPEVDYPTQPPMMLFKQFLSQQDDNIGDEDAIKKYNEYKLDFKKQQINEFFLAHKEEEWFKAKYHPEECGKKNEESRAALRNRVQAFIHLFNKGMVDGLAVELEKSDELVRLLDAAVILMEGGTDFDLKSLDEPEPPEKEETSRSRTNSESQPSEKIVTQDQPEGPIRITFEKKEKKDGEKSDEKQSGEAALDISMTPQQQQLKKMAEQFSQNKQQDGSEKPEKKKKRHRDKTEYSYESGSESDSGSASDSESEPAPPGVDEPPPPGTGGAAGHDPGAEAGSQDTKGETEKPEKEGANTEEKEKDSKEIGGDAVQDEMEKDDGPKALHKTNSIFLRNLAPTITKQEVEAMCKRYPGFLRVALQDPQPERRFFRRGWVTFDRTVNIKDICWNLNNIRLRDCEMGAIVNRELKQRVRPINGMVAHRQIVKADIKHGAKIIQNLDTKWGLWDDLEENGEKKDVSKESFGLVSKNPVLKNITDYLVEEGSYEEEELLGQTVEEKPKEANPEVTIERDEKLLRVLDRMVLYLRIVHSFDFYSAVEYPNEDEMPHRCGIMHARGPNPPNRLTQHDVNDWISSFDSKVTPFADLKVKLDDEEALKLGKKDPEAEVEKFVTANTQELAKDKWLCPLSGKKFKGPEFVRKHIFNKHGEKVEEVKKEVAFFNNYLMDAKRPQLPEHPGMKQQSSGPSMGGGGRGEQYNMPPGGYQGPPQQGMMGYNQPRPPMMYQDNGPPGGPYGSHQGYQGRGPNNPYRQDPRRDRGYMGGRSGRDRTRQDPRSIIEYRDLDAPDDMDIF